MGKTRKVDMNRSLIDSNFIEKLVKTSNFDSKSIEKHMLFDRLARKTDRVACKHDRVAINFNRVVGKFIEVVGNHDRLAGKTDRVAINHDRVAINFCLSFLKNVDFLLKRRIWLLPSKLPGPGLKDYFGIKTIFFVSKKGSSKKSLSS